MSRRTIFGRTKGAKIALIPIYGTISMTTNISTRTGNSLITMGDGSSVISRTNTKFNDFTDGVGSYILYSYSSAFTGNISITFLAGLKDVYSLRLGNIVKSDNTTEKYNILDIGTFLKQFPNLYSFYITDYCSDPVGRSIIKGDLSQIPDSTERVLIGDLLVVNPNVDIYLNLSNFSSTSNLKWFSHNNGNTDQISKLKVIGDLAKLPVSCNFFSINPVNGTYLGNLITYTAGKTWASSFDTLFLPIALTTTETDNALIDANNSIVTAIGGKSFTFQGVRTSTSNTAVAGLITKGFTVNCELNDRLIMPLSSNLLDSSTFANNATIVGTEIHSSGGLVISSGNYAYIPNTTSLDFRTGSLSFGCTLKFNSITSFKGIIGKTINGGVLGRYGFYKDSGSLTGYCTVDGLVTILNTTSLSPYNDGNFHTIKLVCDRKLGTQKLYIDSSLINTTSFTPGSADLQANSQFTIGAYGNSGTNILSGTEFDGIIKDVFVNKF